MTRKTLLLPFILAACTGSEPAPDATVSLKALGDSGVAGTVDFTILADDKIRVDADITGLTPGKHGMHVHEWGDCGANAKGEAGGGAGGHFNPTMVDHGAPNSGAHHPGDFGNLEADAKGRAVYSMTMNAGTFSMTEGDKLNILGRAVIVHEKVDDYGQPTGNAGGRIACGLINVAGGTSKPMLNPNPEPPAS